MYRKLFKNFILVILLSFLVFSCVDESETQKCKSSEVLMDNTCVDKALLCGDVLCSDNEVCKDNTCMDKTLFCGDVLCSGHEICEENVCKKILVFSTYNLYDLKNRDAYRNLAKFIKEKNISLMVSQEIQTQDKEPLLKELNALGVDADIQFSTYGGFGGDEGNDYLAVISLWPIDEVNTILNGRYQDPVSQSYYNFSNMRPVLEIKLKVFDKPLTVFNLHLKAQSPWPVCDDCIKKRRAQAHALEEYIIDNYNPVSDEIIIAGDANTATQTDEDFKEGSTLDILTLKTDDIDENDFLSVNYEYKREATHTRYPSIMDHIILSPELLKRYVDGSIDIITPSGTPSDHKALLLKLTY